MNKLSNNKVKIYILSYNRPDYLREAINSLLIQDFREGDIVVSDNSINDQVFLMMSIEFFNINYIRRSPSLLAHEHFAAVVNETDAEFVFILHDDDRYCTEFLARQLSMIQSDISLAAVSCNGYLINSEGFRQAGHVLPISRSVETYSRSYEVAMRYACSSCIPLSPTIYRSSIIKKIQLRTEFLKVMDAVLFCDLADQGLVAINNEPLYECRIHGEQDSSYFTLAVMEKLDDFFLTRPSSCNEERVKLIELLMMQRAGRYIKHILRDFLNGKKSSIKLLFKDNKITFLILLKVIFRSLLKVIFNKKVFRI
jgi:glycosyltransferase involved in cell wall biosynthesis